VLRQREAEFEIRFNGWELISNRCSLSEQFLAQLVCRRVKGDSPRILIGGLGMGFTLRAALDAVGPDAQVTVCELVHEVIDWNLGPLAEQANRPLDDSRVVVCKCSIVDVLSTGRQTFDAVILDVDNGPGCILYQPNQFLYSTDGLKCIKEALGTDGILGVWSAERSASFENALEAAGLRWQQENVGIPGYSEVHAHTVYIAQTVRQ